VILACGMIMLAGYRGIGGARWHPSHRAFTGTYPGAASTPAGLGYRSQILETRISVQVMENGEPDFGRPSWMPPADVLAAIVPAGQFLIRAKRIIVALSHLSVYPNGCMLDVRASARGHDVASGVFERIVFTAQFGAGITAEMHDKTAPRWLPGGKAALVLMQYGQEGNSTVLSAADRRADYTLRLWLYPLPPPEPGTLSIVSPNLGPEPGRLPAGWAGNHRGEHAGAAILALTRHPMAPDWSTTSASTRMDSLKPYSQHTEPALVPQPDP